MSINNSKSLNMYTFGNIRRKTDCMALDKFKANLSKNSIEEMF